MKNNPRGTIFFVDISGYSRFVKETENEVGAMIIPELLNAIIKAQKLSFKISEIEGDAILFYHFGPAYPIPVILSQFEAMLDAFNQEIEILKADSPQVVNLTIKLVVHYGIIGRFSVSGFYKLYGQTIVEAHRLLKNHVPSKSYALITEEYFQEHASQHLNPLQKGSQRCELYDVGELCYTYYAYRDEPVQFQLKAIA